MMVTEEAAARVQRSWAMVLTSTTPKQFTRAIYAHLFSLDPDARALFTADLDLQYSKFGMTMDFFVNHLTEASALQPGAADLGARHVHYGVQPEHYDTLGAAFIAALRDQLGTRFTSDDADAWQCCCTAVSNMMRGGADQDAASGPKS